MANDSKTWRCGKYELSFDRPRIMGVLNVTPDSFSDGGEHFDQDAAIEYGVAMLDAGADIIDVGGESTRPGFTPVNPDEEARRVLPVVRALAKEGAIVSIDTRHVAVAKAAVRCGASIVNDVTGFTDPKMVEFVKTSTCGVIVMHAGEVAAPARNMIAEIPLTCVSNCSRIYESEPAYETRQDTFANAIIEIKTELAPLVLLDELLKIEAELGRDRSKKAKANGPRTIDLDLLWMDGEIHGGKKLRLPHPLIGERDFVLVPLEDLMHDPARFFRYNGVEVKEPEDRVGHIVGELGRM